MPQLSGVVIKYPKIFSEYNYKLFVQCAYVKRLSVIMLWKTPKLQAILFVFDKALNVLGQNRLCCEGKKSFSLLNKLLAYISCITQASQY